MSFDISFHQPGSEPDTPLSAVVKAALAGVIESYGGPAEPDEYGYFFDLAGGGSIEFFAGKTAGGMLALRADTSRMHMQFIFDILCATGWVAIVGGSDLLVLSTKPIAIPDALDDDVEGAHLLTVSDGDDVAAALAKDFGDWSDYRDKVVATTRRRTSIFAALRRLFSRRKGS